MADGYIKVKAHPDAKKNKFLRKAEDTFEIWVKEPAENGRANSAIIQIVAREISAEPKRLMIIKGAKSASKILRLL